MPELDKTAKAATRAKTATSKTFAPAKKTAKKAASAAAPKRKAAAVETATAAAPTRAVSVEERQRRIAEAAYYLAERSGFRGDPGRYWLLAEAEIDAQLLRERDRRG